jgi:hypothetical protein
MSGIDVTADRPQPLPVIPRPRHEETLTSYLRRLAAANHLRTSYLRKYLCAPPGYTGSVRVQRLAILTARSVEALTRAFPSLQIAPRARNVTGIREAKHQARIEFYEAIRREAQTNHSIRDLTSMFDVRSNVIIRALATTLKPPIKPQSKRNPILDPFQHIVDAILVTQQTPNAWQIWEHLVDEHAAEVSYATVRDYISRKRRQANDSAGQTG